MSVSELKTTKKIVESILETHKLARSNDFYLIVLYLREKGVKIDVDHRQFLELSGSVSTVLRMRRQIQNTDGKFLPPQSVIDKRRQRSESFRTNIRLTDVI